MLCRYTLLQTALTTTVLSMNFYGVSESLKYNSWKGFVLSIASIIALYFCVQIIKALKRLDSEQASDSVNG